MGQSKISSYVEGTSLLDQLKENLEAVSHHIPASKTSYATHGLYPYVAKFVPQFPELFIRLLSKSRETVLDPMCGSGTTLVEALLLNRNAYGIDIDPLAQKLSKVATTPLDDRELRPLESGFIEHLKEVKQKNKKIDYSFDFFPNHNIWFRDDILSDIFLIRDEIDSYLKETSLRDLALIALGSIVKDVSNSDPRDIFPEINKDHPINTEANVLSSFDASLRNAVSRVREFTNFYDANTAKAEIVGNDARKMNLANKSVDLIVTSPPYAYAMDYVRIHKLVLYSLFQTSNEFIQRLSREIVGTDKVSTKREMEDFDRIEFAKSFIHKFANERKSRAYALWNYLRDMRDITGECSRVLKPGKYLVFVIGNATLRGKEFSTANALKKISESFGLSSFLTFEREYFARRMGRKRANHSAVTKEDVFLVLQKQ